MALALAKDCANLRTGAVRELIVNGSNIGVDGARALATALAQNSSLTSLHLEVSLQQREEVGH